MKSRETLSISASIRPIIDFGPKTVNLKGKAGETQSSEIFITGSENRPLVIEVKYFDLKGIVEYNIETIEEGKKYRVSVQNAPEASGNFRGYLKFKTNYPEKPELSVYIRGIFR